MKAIRVSTMLVSTLFLVITLLTSGVLAQTEAHDHDHPPQNGAVQNKPGHPMPGMMDGKMMQQHAKMMAEMKAMDEKLDGLVATMNAATGSDKVDAIAAIVTEIVAQRKAMDEKMDSMHNEMMQGMMGHMPMGKVQSGMDMSSEPQKPQSSVSTTHTLKVTATMPSSAIAGDNTLNIVITDPTGRPITAAKVTTEVAMTSMDMGTSYPSVKETGKGHYTTTVSFSMAGPWRVTVKVAAPGRKQQSNSFDFTAN